MVEPMMRSVGCTITFRAGPRLQALSIVLFVLSACSEPKLDQHGNPITVGRFRLRTYPKGAQVWANGKLVAVTTPATLILPGGQHRLKIQLKGAEAIEHTIHVEAGDSRELSLHLPRPAPATLTILSDIEGADVRINGYRRGHTPLHQVVTRPGPVDMTITAPDGRAQSLQTTLEISEAKTMEVHFGPPVSQEDDNASSPMSQEGRLTLGLQPEGQVFLDDGTWLGSTPLVNKRMPAGVLDVILRSSDGERQRRVTIEIRPDTTTIYRFSLRKDDRPTP